MEKNNRRKGKEILKETIVSEETVTLCYEFLMNHSFMMGMFNYLSSLVHAATQLYVRYLCAKIQNNFKHSYKNLKFQGLIDLIAHSDDSGGKSYCKNLKSLIGVSTIHEIIMKGVNQMISKKKSCISRTYFEVTSVLYFNGVLVPMLGKFSGNLKISPSDDGYSEDIKFAITKCNEILRMGGTLQTSYLMLKICTSMVRYFYEIPITKESYNRSIDCLGVPDSHPLLYLLAGADFDDERLLHFDKDSFNMCNLFLKYLAPLKNERKFKPTYTYINKYKEKFSVYDKWVNKLNLTEIERKLIKNIDKSTTVGNMIQFCTLKDDIKFTWGMDYENISRRITRVKWVNKTKCIETLYGFMSYKDINNLFTNIFVIKESKGEIIGVDHVSKIKEKIRTEMLSEEMENFEESYRRNIVGRDDILTFIDLLKKSKFNLENMQTTSVTIRPNLINIDIGLSP